MSELPDEDRQETTGSVRKLVGRQCRQVVEESPFEALIEGYDEWRRDHQMRTLQLDILAPMLATWNITVWRLDFGVNECPSDVLRSISAGYSGYFFVHANARRTGRKLQRLKKLDPDFGKVLNFVDKHSNAKIVVADVLAQLEAAVALTQKTTNTVAFATWGPVLVAVMGAVLALAIWLRRPWSGTSRRHHKTD
ncbi:unnamed protein product [Durusdinium trenchii]|uniref:Uncharacterized protein n=1 Tax=Durusdinium trenchii TaxID=1381693 RepID=A0ABP0KFX7_9DINO